VGSTIHTRGLTVSWPELDRTDTSSKKPSIDLGHGANQPTDVTTHCLVRLNEPHACPDASSTRARIDVTSMAADADKR